MAMFKAIKKPVTVEYIRLDAETLEEVLEYDMWITKPIWIYPGGNFTYDFDDVEGIRQGIVVYTSLTRTVVPFGNYIVKDEDGYVFMTEEVFVSQYDVLVNIGTATVTKDDSTSETIVIDKNITVSPKPKEKPVPLPTESDLVSPPKTKTTKK